MVVLLCARVEGEGKKTAALGAEGLGDWGGVGRQLGYAKQTKGQRGRANQRCSIMSCTNRSSADGPCNVPWPISV